jgi:hypothetical protein
MYPSDIHNYYLFPAVQIMRCSLSVVFQFIKAAMINAMLQVVQGAKWVVLAVVGDF